MAMNTKTVGMVGLGLMGTALTERLLGAAYSVRVWNRSREKADPLIALGAVWDDNPFAVCDRVIISLFTSDTVAEVLGQMESGLHAGQILIDTTTGSPDQAAAFGDRLKSCGVNYLDAPISGSSEQTRRGEATAIVGGPAKAYQQCRDLFECLSKTTIYAGSCGNGSKMKLVSNLVLGLNRAALAEGLAFARALDLQDEATLQVLAETMAYSRIMDTKGRKMIESDFRTQAKLSQHLKDVHLMIDAARDAGLRLPLSETHSRLLERAQEAGFGEADNCAVIRAYDTVSRNDADT
jgi:3-hydroxyisobutyrate dehydrogenase-like beta-hydroxyacid dehydrogenase